MPDKPQGPGDQITFRGSFNALYLLCMLHIRCVIPFLRAQMGSGALGWYAIVAGVFMFYLAHAIYDQPLLNFFLVWLVAIVVQWMLTGRTLKAGALIHSQYEGRPCIAMLVCKNESMAKLVVEPLICLAAGYVLLGYSDVLGKLVMSAAFSLIFLENFDRHVMNKQERQVIDARLEAEYLSERVRNRLGY